MSAKRASEYKKQLLGIVQLFWVVVFATVSVNCDGQQARRATSVKTASFYRMSAERNKIILDRENKLIQKYIKEDQDLEYLQSNEGFYYAYLVSEPEPLPKPVEGNVLYMTYQVSKINGELIYDNYDIGEKRVVFGKDQNLFIGLRKALGVMKSGEKIRAFFPSMLAYGYHGDEQKIGVGMPLRCDIELKKIIIDSDFK